MKTRTMAVILCLMLVGQGCSPINVRTDYDREANFARYETFKWMPPPKKKKKNRAIVKPNSLLDKRIRRAVERELEARGYRMVRTGPADALLAYHVGVQDRIDVDRYGYWGRRVHVHRYKEGSLIIDIVDPGEKQLVWRGAAQGAVGHPHNDPEKIDEAIAKVFERYPPQ